MVKPVTMIAFAPTCWKKANYLAVAQHPCPNGVRADVQVGIS
jgi:hypothetical protein